jgi:hypothetical protein
MTIADPALTVESNDLCDARFEWLNPRQADPRAGCSNEGTRGGSGGCAVKMLLAPRITIGQEPTSSNQLLSLEVDARGQ